MKQAVAAQYPAVLTIPSEFPEGQQKEEPMRDKKRAVSCRMLFMALAFLAAFATAAHAQQFGASESFVEIHGYMDLTYYDFQKQGDPDLPYTDGGGIPTFDQDHLVLFFGSNISRNLKFVSEIHWEHAFNEPELPQANIQWTVAQPVTIVFGRFWLPFGTLGKHRIYEPTNALVSFPYTVSQFLPFHNAQNGVKLQGSPGLIHYELAIGNGFAGFDEDGGKKMKLLALDNNQNKAVTGRVQVNAVENGYIAFSFTSGKWADDNAAGYNLWGTDGQYSMGPLMIQGEYTAGKLTNPMNAVATVDEVVRCNNFVVGCDEPVALRDNMGDLSIGDHNRMSWYVQGSYEVLKNTWDMDLVTLIARYDYFKRYEMGDVGDRARFTGGVNIMPQPHFHLKAEYQTISEPGSQKSTDNNGVMLQAVLDF
jgi:hypothetical protein